MFNLFSFIIFMTRLEINKILSTRQINSDTHHIDIELHVHLKLQVVYLSKLLKLFKGTLRVLPLITIQMHS